MSRVSDVLAFATKHGDYWDDLLTGSEYPEELVEDEIRALEAAREHIEGAVVELLHTVGSHLNTRLSATPARFKGASTAKNRLVRLAPPVGTADKLYNVEFSLARCDDGPNIALFASLVVKKAFLDDFLRTLGTLGVQHEVDNYHVYSAGILLGEGDEFATIAAKACDKVIELLRGCSPPAPAAAA